MDEGSNPENLCNDSVPEGRLGGEEDEAGESNASPAPQPEGETSAGPGGLASDGGSSISAPQKVPQVGSSPGRSAIVGAKCRPREGINGEAQRSELKMMKDKFSKLLLGEDMSGSGKGVSSAVALSNAITNLAAFVYGDHRRLEPLPADKKAKWKKEVGWILSIAEHIVEFVACKQTSKDGQAMEVMRTQQRKDLQLNIPLLVKLDGLIMELLEEFRDQKEFWYVSKDDDEAEKGEEAKTDDKWWMPIVKVPPDGLSDVFRRWLQYQKESIHRLLKMAMAVNSQVLMEMEVPEPYIDSLPKNGKSTLGEAMYKNMAADVFDPEEFLESMDLSSEHKIVDLKNKIEASVIIWRKKLHEMECANKSSWSISLEKREELEVRAESLLVLMKQKYPGTSQTALDISKIQHNRDVGMSILESYSRILESLAYSVMSRIEDVLSADSMTENPSGKSKMRRLSREPEAGTTLSDYKTWNSDANKEAVGDVLKKPPDVVTNDGSHLEKVENAGSDESPEARH